MNLKCTFRVFWLRKILRHLRLEISKKKQIHFSYADICTVDYTGGCNAKALHGFDCVDRFLDLLVII